MAQEENHPKKKRFARRRVKIREKLQAIEDELIEAGYDDFVVATDRGYFRWTLAPAAN
jgi:hypothetical protein